MMSNTHTILIPVLAFCEVVCSGTLPSSVKYPAQIVTIGDHVRKRRIDLSLSYAAASLIMGLGKDTVRFWETGRNVPHISAMPAIIKFLGYDPYGVDTSTLGGKIKQYRYSKGLSQQSFAKLLNVYPSVVMEWEQNKFSPTKRSYRRLMAWLTTLECDHLLI